MKFVNPGKKLILVFFILTCNLANAQFQNISNPFIKNYTTKEYNGQPDNFAGIEDNKGLMFFGNLWGILEFDGVSWRNIYFPNGSSGVSFAKHKNGTIYCGGRGEIGFLESDSTGFLKYTSLLHLLDKKLDFSDVWSTFHIDSSIIFCSYEAIIIFKNKSLTVIEPKTSFERAFLVHGILYVREKDRGLCYLHKNKLQIVKGGAFFSKMSVSIILPFEKDKLLIVGNNNFYLLNNGNVSKSWNFDNNDNLKGSKFFTGIAMMDTSYLLATNTKGIIHLDRNGKIQNIFNKSNGLISNDILNIFIDSYKNIWVMTRGGISKIELNGPFNYINDVQGITGINYASNIFNDNLYLGTSEGLYNTKLSIKEHWLQGKSLKMVPSTEGTVWALKQFGDDLFCGHNEGIFVVNKNTLYQIPVATGVWCFIQAKGFNNLILAGTYRGIIVLEKNGFNWKVRGAVKSFNESARYLIQDKMEEFWVSHGNKGLFKLTLNHTLDSVLKIKVFGTKEELGSLYNNTVYSHNNQVIVTNNQGFYKYDFSNEHFEPWEQMNSALGNFSTIQRFVADTDNAYWVILNDEKIVRIINHKDSFKTDFVIRKFHKRLAGSFEYMLPFNKDITFISTLDGVAIFDKNKFNKNVLLYKKHFKAHVRKVELTRDTFLTIDAGNRNINSNVPEIKYKQNSIRFSYSSNCFEDIELTRYQFFLSGFDNSWSPWLATTQKEYTNLPPGHYKFSVRALNSYNIVSKEDYYEFVILRPWYKSGIALIFYSMLLTLIIYGTYRYIVFRFKIQKKKLELKKERELWILNKKHQEEQMKKENEILKLNNEKLSADLANLEQQDLIRKKDLQLKEEFDRSKLKQIHYEQEKHILEITHKNKELSILAMQIAHKNELILKIREYLTTIAEKNHTSDLKKILAHLFEYIDNDSAHDKEWKEFQEHFDLVHSSFLRKLKATYPNISPALLKLSAYLRVKMSNKQIARLMNTTVESVMKSRYRLREKLKLMPDENLDDFIEKF